MKESDIYSPFDLQHYVKIILRYWYFVALFAIIAGISVLAYSIIQPPTFTAISDVSLLNVRSEVIFAPDFRTVPQEESSNTTAPESRAKALKAMAQNTSLLISVYEQLPEDEKRKYPFSDFLKSVHVRNMGDVLRFEVVWHDPVIAAKMVNLWTKLYVELANKSYINSSRTSEEAKKAAMDAFKDYTNSQQALERFLRESDLPDLRRQVGEIDLLLEDLEKQKADAMQMGIGAHFLASSHLMNLAKDAYLENMDYSVQRKKEYQQARLDQWYRRLGALQSMENHYSDLQKQFSEPPASPSSIAGDALAMIFARSGIFGNPTLPDMLLQVDVEQLASEANITSNVQDIQAMLIANRQEQREAESRIDALSKALFNGERFNIPDELSSEHKLITTINKGVESVFQINAQEALERKNFEDQPLSRAIKAISDRRKNLSAKIATLEAQQKTLEHTRDTNWNLFVTLDNKAAEIQAQSSIGAPQVRLAIAAQTPIEEDDKLIGIKVLLSSMLGAIFGIAFTVIWDAHQ